MSPSPSTASSPRRAPRVFRLSPVVPAGGGLVVLALVGILVLAAAPQAGEHNGAAARPTATATYESVIGGVSYAHGYYTLHDLKRNADLIAVVQVTAQGADATHTFGASGGLDNTAQVVQVLANDGLNGSVAVGSTIHILQLGGPGVRNDDDPHATLGERAVVFLSVLPAKSGRYVILMGGFGHYPSIGGYIKPVITGLPSDFASSAKLSATISAGRMTEADFIKTLLAA